MAINLLSDKREELLPILVALRRHFPFGYLLPIQGHRNTVVFAANSPLCSKAEISDRLSGDMLDLKLDLSEEIAHLTALPEAPELLKPPEPSEPLETGPSIVYDSRASGVVVEAASAPSQDEDHIC